MLTTTGKKTTINLIPKTIIGLMGNSLACISEGDHYAGVVYTPSKDSVKIFDSLILEINAQEGEKNVTLSLNKHEAAVLFYATTIGGGSAYASGMVLNKKTHAVISGLVKAGFGFPERNLVY